MYERCAWVGKREIISYFNCSSEYNNIIICWIILCSSYHDTWHKNGTLLVCYAAPTSRYLPTFWDNPPVPCLSVPSSRDCLTHADGPRLSRNVGNYQLCNVTSQKTADLIYTATEPRNHTWYKVTVI